MWLASGSLVYVSRQNTPPKGSPNKENRNVNTSRLGIEVQTKGHIVWDLAPQTLTDPLTQCSVKECVDTLV